MTDETDSTLQEVREALADDLGGDPEGYDAEAYFRDSGGRNRARTDGSE